ncbi:MAG: glycosyltransferase family A protein [Bacillota bacterium]|nr:glycosyltransferase family A protein [Bacillota bacterium]
MSTKPVLEASVVIPTYNRREFLRKCLLSLFEQTAPGDSYEIVVVDDGSTDGTGDLVAELSSQAPCRVFCQHQPNSGRARARNAGIRAARGRIIIFLDSDMVVDEGFIAAHLRCQKEPGRIVHGQVINTPDFSDPRLAKPKLTDYSRAFFATGNVSVEREKLLEAGLFSEAFTEYGWEDLELGTRLRHLGLVAVRCPEARSWHYLPRLTFAQVSSIVRRERERGHMAVLYYRMHPEWRVKLATLLTPAFFALDRLLSLGHWPERPATLRLLARLDRPATHLLFRALTALVRNHAYAEGLREGLARY